MSDVKAVVRWTLQQLITLCMLCPRNKILGMILPSTLFTASMAHAQIHKIYVDGRWGFIDGQGEEIAPPTYLAVTSFTGSHHVAQRADMEWALVNKDGDETFIFPNPADRIRYLGDTLYLMTRDDGGATVERVLDRRGQFRPANGVSANWDEGGFESGRYIVTKNGMKGFADRFGNVVIAPAFDDVRPFSEGLAVVKSEGRYGFVNWDGDLVVNYQYSSASSFSEGLAAVSDGEVHFFITHSGAKAFEGNFSDAGDFHEGLAHARPVDAEKWGFIDHSGRFVIEPRFMGVGPFSGGVAGFIQSPTFESGDYLGDVSINVGLISRAGDVIQQVTEIGEAGPFRCGLAWVDCASAGEHEARDANGVSYARGYYVDKTGEIVWRSPNEDFYGL
jgi:hypothetical protein